jgi:ferredoxin
MIYTFAASGGHNCPQCGLCLRSCYVELPNREAMVALFGIKWSHEYSSEDEAGVERFELRRIIPGACACGGLGRSPWAPPK